MSFFSGKYKLTACLLCIFILLLSLTGCGKVDPSPINLKTFIRPDSPNNYLACPKDYCQANIDEVAPIFNLNVDTLENLLKTIISKQPRTKLLAQNDAEHSLQYVQRSLVFRFPDIINIKLIPLNSNSSTLAIYSYSIYGHYDFNVNKKRVQNLLEKLKRSVQNAN